MTTGQAVYLTFSGAIDLDAARRIVANINGHLNEGASTIYISMSSGGGSILDGIYLYNYIKGLSADIAFHNVGNISSIALPVFLAGKRRYANKSSYFMMHGSTWTMQGALNSAQLLSQHSSLSVLEGLISQILIYSVTLSAEVLAKRLSEEVYLTPEEAKGASIVHEVEEFNVPPGAKVFII